MNLFTRFRQKDLICYIRIDEIEEMIMLYRALRYLKFATGDKNGPLIDEMMRIFERWHRIYNNKKLKDIYTFTPSQ